MDSKKGISARILAKEQIQPTFPVALLQRLRSEFNDSFRKALEMHHWFKWPLFNNLWGRMKTGHLRLYIVYIPGAITAPPPHLTR